MTTQIFSIEKPKYVIFHQHSQKIYTKNAILGALKLIFKVLILVFLEEHTKSFSNMMRTLLSDVSIQIPPRVQNQLFHPHWFSKGVCHWNSKYPWFSKVSWVFQWTMFHGFSKESFEFRSIGFPRRLLQLVKLSSILFVRLLSRELDSNLLCLGRKKDLGHVLFLMCFFTSQTTRKLRNCKNKSGTSFAGHPVFIYILMCIT